MACRSASVNLVGGWSPPSSLGSTIPPPAVVSAIVKTLSPLVGDDGEDDDSSSVRPLLARFEGDDVGWIFLVCTKRGLAVLITVLA